MDVAGLEEEALDEGASPALLFLAAAIDLELLILKLYIIY
jgi:hypothetical protein